MNIKEKALEIHEKNKGKVGIVSKVKVQNLDDLALAYTPGVAEPCLKIKENPSDVYRYTMKGNMVGVVTNGTAVLGLGNIGPKASLPVMEGKAILFKELAGIDSFPICIDSTDSQEIVNIVSKISTVFGAINLEDIKSPQCIEVEDALEAKLDIPVFHDDQHGTAIVVAAGILNALKVVKKSIEDVQVVINGAGSAGMAIAKMLLLLKVNNIVLVDKTGALYKGVANLNEPQKKLVEVTNKYQEKGTLKEVLKGKDIFVGVSAPGIVTAEMVSTMAKDAIVFALANPVPEIMPDEAKKGGARIVATGRSDFPNQVNNCLAFPGVFRGALDAKATKITEEMKKAAIYALKNIIKEQDLNENNILPTAFNKEVVKQIALAVCKVAKETGVVRK
ncbi:NAD(P)-dependent malic enzyme ['Catharanthus roseus' aster yellows phytoplasma]|uniref:NAD-dependent malic enzyme n=1 Tax='Catharanthus roseus' aster yellows phytoplasma TaxID=1193712 RepID=A0A4P6MA53_9MOLU|nr:malic enzyme-like NAD(P)-binding protein ['Catharanthus roseus' aster yellows phytoplasma]QBF23680.1 NAD-dependent malic enzyme ['Catharanthus roseus' aster yellows phytoplasma]